MNTKINKKVTKRGNKHKNHKGYIFYIPINECEKVQILLYFLTIDLILLSGFSVDLVVKLFNYMVGFRVISAGLFMCYLKYFIKDFLWNHQMFYSHPNPE